MSRIIPPRIVVIGGGISGLAAAYFLTEDDSGLDVTLVEGDKRLGGTMGSEAVDGFVFERGANGFLDNVDDTVDLVGEIGLADRLRRADPVSRTRAIYRNGRLHALPSSPLGIFRSPLLSIGGRLRIISELFQPRCAEGVEDSVASFGRRRLGDEFTRTFLDPMVSGIHGGDIERLSLPAAFPKIAAMESEHGSLIRAFLKRRQSAASDPGQTKRSGPGGPGGTLCSFPGGLEELVQGLAAKLGERVRLGTKIKSVRKEGKRFSLESSEGGSEQADGVVLALPAHRAASLFASTQPELSRDLEAIPYAPLAVLCFGFPRAAVKNPLDGFGFLIPRDQGLRLLGTIFVSSIFPEHAPEGMVSLRCMIGGACDSDALDESRETLERIVLDELRALLGIEGDPAITRLYRYSRGIPQYNLGHRARVERIERCLWDLPGLFVTGNAYHGIGINDCVREARRKARAVREYFRGK